MRFHDLYTPGRQAPACVQNKETPAMRAAAIMHRRSTVWNRIG
ncbi:hypothetical protein NH44784_060401 [Achromobacter xylosoxidans NH44784-1996]|nr:hypothetical protein NH44784_060401 [Achromobacter xylosoxidans NH44784-1996]